MTRGPVPPRTPRLRAIRPVQWTLLRASQSRTQLPQSPSVGRFHRIKVASSPVRCKPHRTIRMWGSGKEPTRTMAGVSTHGYRYWTAQERTRFHASSIPVRGARRGRVSPSGRADQTPSANSSNSDCSCRLPLQSHAFNVPIGTSNSRVISA